MATMVTGSPLISFSATCVSGLAKRVISSGASQLDAARAASGNAMTSAAAANAVTARYEPTMCRNESPPPLAAAAVLYRRLSRPCRFDHQIGKQPANTVMYMLSNI